MAAALTEGTDGNPTEPEIPLQIFTVNVNGLNRKDKKDSKKRTHGEKLLDELERLESENSEVDVIFLGETHVKDRDDWKIFKEDWEIFFTSYDSRSRGCFSRKRLTKGAAILVNKKRDFEVLQEKVDESGRYVIVNCWISGTLCTFVSVYHRSDETGLLTELSEKIKYLYADILVVGGDFNTALVKKYDTTSKKNNVNHNDIKEELLPFMEEHKLKDAWREKHPNGERHPDEEKYTYKYRRNCVIYYSRLDYIFINADKQELVHDCTINKDNIADHRSVSLILDLKDFLIFSTEHNLPEDEYLTELRPDIILLTEAQVNDENYNKIKEKWNVLWSDCRNAAILMAKGQRGIHILFTVYHKNYVILHCIVLGMLHTFVSACHPIEKKMLREIMPSYSGRIVIGGDFSTSELMNELNRNKFNITKGGSMRYLIHDTLSGASEIRKEILDRSYFLLILHLPKMKTEDVDITQSLSKIKIHCKK